MPTASKIGEERAQTNTCQGGWCVRDATRAMTTKQILKAPAYIQHSFAHPAAAMFTLFVVRRQEVEGEALSAPRFLI